MCSFSAVALVAVLRHDCSGAGAGAGAVAGAGAGVVAGSDVCLFAQHITGAGAGDGSLL